MAGMAGGRRLPATHYRKSADKAVGADKTLRCVYFLKFLYLLLFCLFFSRQGSQDQAPPGSRDIPGSPDFFKIPILGFSKI